jgi:hypothetical protein
MKYLVVIFLAVSCLAASAQYRMVNGQVYPVDDPSAWRVFNDLQVVDVTPDGGLVVREVYQHDRAKQEPYMKGYGVNSYSFDTYGQSFVLLHYSTYQAPYPGMNLGYVRAMLVPGSGIDGGTYDIGTPWYPPQPDLTPAQIAARKAMVVSNIVFNLKVAVTNGDAVAEYQLGKRYLKGNGVLQDQAMGKILLQKSADQGDTEASNYLQNFMLTNVVSPQNLALTNNVTAQK